MKILRIVTLAAVILISACRTNNEQAIFEYDIQKTAIGEQAMVVSAHPEATRVGLEILKKRRKRHRCCHRCTISTSSSLSECG